MIRFWYQEGIFRRKIERPIKHLPFIWTMCSSMGCKNNVTVSILHFALSHLFNRDIFGVIFDGFFIMFTYTLVTEGWQSGRMRTLGKGVYGQLYRGFESRAFRFPIHIATLHIQHIPLIPLRGFFVWNAIHTIVLMIIYNKKSTLLLTITYKYVLCFDDV
jgi:hypothetical protein